MSEAHEHEFDDVASWTAELLASEDRAAAVVAACRGSGSPAALAWLAESLELAPGVRLVDVGAGLGGPAAWVADRYGVDVVGAEPMEGAVRGSTRLFGAPSIVAAAEALPFRDRSFDAAWSLGVLDTVDDPAGVLAEARRCLVPGGRLGLLAFVAEAPIADDDLPEGNDFPTVEGLLADLDRSGFEVLDRVTSASLPPIPARWREQQDAIDRELERDHQGDARWTDARSNEEAFAALLAEEKVAAVLLLARSRSGGSRPQAAPSPGR